ncbi:hypothetical protein SDC9_146624 [bioreactor metagenome]|uniref:Uncharacterized protein n=1 Tax=bioreactor metagenome TaxID=1076179 RepID=A0A645EF92_9ZZZZ
MTQLLQTDTVMKHIVAPNGVNYMDIFFIHIHYPDGSFEVGCKCTKYKSIFERVIENMETRTP